MITFPKQKTVETNRTFRAWKTYHGMYLHFTGSYDYFKYFGNAPWGTIASMEKYFAKFEYKTGFSWQRGFFTSLGKKMTKELDLIYYYLSQLTRGKNYPSEFLDDYYDEAVENSLQEEKKLLAELSIVKLDNYDLTKPLKQSEKDEIFRPFISDSEILGNKKNYSLLTELKTSGSDDTHQEIHFYGSPSVSIGQEHGRFQPVSSSTYSFTRDDDLMETTLRNRISAESVEAEKVESFQRKFILSEGDRYFHRDNFNEPNKYNFSVKSTHYYSSEMLFKKSIAILIDKCQKTKQSFIHLLQDKEHREIDVEEKNDYLYHFTLYNQGHTMGNLLQSHIVRRSLGEDSLLQLCGYKKPHPLEDKIMIHASMKPEHATDKLVSQKLQMLSTFMIEQLDEISKELNDLLASAEEVM